MQEYSHTAHPAGDAGLISNNTVGALPVLACSQKPVGKRASRSTDSLSSHQANGVIEAALHARRIGLPFNRHVTIRLERVGISDSQAMKAISGFLTRIRDWLRKRDKRTAFVWVRECGTTIGSHVHILLHLPPGVTFESHRSRRWIEAVSGRPYKAGTILTKRIASSAYDENLGTLVSYLCKGASPEVADALELDRRKPGGSVTGKRAGWSENVGAKARRLWLAKRDGWDVVWRGRASLEWFHPAWLARWGANP